MHSHRHTQHNNTHHTQEPPPPFDFTLAFPDHGLSAEAFNHFDAGTSLDDDEGISASSGPFAEFDYASIEPHQHT
jgi:hypothetical protein